MLPYGFVNFVRSVHMEILVKSIHVRDLVSHGFKPQTFHYFFNTFLTFKWTLNGFSQFNMGQSLRRDKKSKNIFLPPITAVQGGVQLILTVPYRGGEGGSKIQKIALRNL